VAASGDAGTPSDAAPSTHVMPSSPDAATNLGTEPAATPPPESTPPPAPPPVVAAERPPHVSTPSTPHVSAPTTPRVDASTTPQVPVATRSNPSPAPAGPVATHLQRGAIGGTYDRWAAAVHIGAVESAANRCISRTHPAAGSGSYRVEVPPDGDVTQVTGGDPEVRQCLSRAFRIIRWSPPPGEVSQFVTIDYDAVP